MIDDPDAVAELGRLREVVRDEQRGGLALAQHGGELARRAGTGAGVERGQRLVEQQDLGRAGQRPGDGDALSLSAAEGAGPRIGEVGEAKSVEQRECTRASLRSREPAEWVGDVLAGAQVREQGVVLEDVAAAAAFGRHVDVAGGVEPGFAVGLDATVRRAQQPGRHPKDAGLARSGRSGKREALPRPDLQVHV